MYSSNQYGIFSNSFSWLFIWCPSNTVSWMYFSICDCRFFHYHALVKRHLSLHKYYSNSKFTSFQVCFKISEVYLLRACLKVGIRFDLCGKIGRHWRFSQWIAPQPLGVASMAEQTYKYLEDCAFGKASEHLVLDIKGKNKRWSFTSNLQKLISKTS